MSTNNITLYNFAGCGDVINSTASIRLIKTRKPDCFIRICCKERDKDIFSSNPFIDELICLKDDVTISKAAYKNNYKTYRNLNIWGNEVNTWAGAGSHGIEDDFCFASAMNINMFFGEHIITKNDNLLPEVFYTEDEILKANEFIEEYSPYVVLETESFSGQYIETQQFINSLLEKLSGIDLKIKIFTSSMKHTLNYPFYSLNNFSLKEIGLILQGSRCFYGIGSGMTVISFERSLTDFKRVMDYWSSLNFYTRHRNFNMEYIPKRTMLYRFCSDISKLQ